MIFFENDVYYQSIIAIRFYFEIKKKQSYINFNTFKIINYKS